MIKRIVVCAAGNGTRLLPATAAIPKEMFPVIDTPVIEHVLLEAIIPGVEEVILITNRKKSMMSTYVMECPSNALKQKLNDVSVRLVHQEERTSEYGTGAALLSVEEHVTEGPFILVFADSFGLPSDQRFEQLAETFAAHHAPAISLIPIQQAQLQIYGIPRVVPLGNGLYRITEILEKPGHAPSEELLATPGGYLLNPDIFDEIKRVKKDANGEIPFTNALSDYCKKHAVYGKRFDGRFFETGNRTDHAKAVLDMSLLRNDTKSSMLEFVKTIK